MCVFRDTHIETYREGGVNGWREGERERKRERLTRR